jgi:nitrous oxidase accessory protein NosD
MTRPILRVAGLAGILSLSALCAADVQAATITANPSNYQSLINGLKPGDTLNLAAGTYPRLLLSSINGAPSALITIQGPASGAPAVITVDPANPGCCNVVQLDTVSYVAIRNLRVDSALNEAIDGINARGTTHDILVENCTLVGQGASQGTIGISTKGTAWNWTIRGNTIVGAGTGMYLGNSAGNFPFINGLIEGNLIQDTIGYNTEIKWQLPYALPAGLDANPHRTIVRNNVWIKTKSQGSFGIDPALIDGPRPNLLVGGFPDSGPGSSDLYEIYGNFFYQNADGEALFQGSGRLALHDNIFVGGTFKAVALQNHDLPLRLAYVYNNTIYGNVTGISLVNGGSLADSLVTGNLVFAPTGISAPVAKDNIVATMANAGNFVNLPSLAFPMDFYPKAGSAAKGATALDMSKFTSQAEYNVDFNRTSKGAFLYRGAYAGEGTNPGWALAATKKLAAPPPPPPAAPKNLRIR